MLAGKISDTDLLDAIREGAVLRVRPKAMTVAVIIAGLVPIMIGTGTGSEVMQRIAAPMVGGMITAPLLSMLVLPAAYYRRSVGVPRTLAGNRAALIKARPDQIRTEYFARGRRQCFGSITVLVAHLFCSQAESFLQEPRLLLQAPLNPRDGRAIWNIDRYRAASFHSDHHHIFCIERRS